MFKIASRSNGVTNRATAKRARTIFSPSPTHLDVSDDALMLKKVDFDWLAIHLPEWFANGR